MPLVIIPIAKAVVPQSQARRQRRPTVSHLQRRPLIYRHRVVLDGVLDLASATSAVTAFNRTAPYIQEVSSHRLAPKTLVNPSVHSSLAMK